MTNAQIITILEEMGKMKEIVGENQFKVIAYERAARLLRGIGKNLEDIYKEEGIKGLEDIGGVGPAIAGHIEELLTKRKCQEHGQLKKKVPSPVLEFLKIPGVGVKTAQKLYNVTRANSIEKLKERITNHRARHASRKARRAGELSIKKEFGKKILDNILRGIGILKKQTKRMLISEADQIANQIVSAIRQITTVTKAEAVGSLRRRQDTIGDIDIICASKNPEIVLGKITNLPFVGKIVNQGQTKAAVIHQDSGRKIDLEILPTENYGSLSQHFTGSKDHNIHLRAWAENKGFSISEYGIKISNLKSQISKSHLKTKKFSTEEDFFRFLKMEYIPPELREDRGEIEAAIEHRLPKLVETKDIKGDLQMHTLASDGENTIREMAESAMALGYQYIAITDHSSGLGITHGQNGKSLLKQKKMIEIINQRLKNQGKNFQILSGVEVNINGDGKIDVEEKILSKLDIVVASIHSGFNQTREKITDRIIQAIKNPYVNVIAHPSGRLIPRRPAYEADWEQIFQAARDFKVAMEINSFPDRLDLPDYLVRIAKEKYGLKFAVNTDSHQKSHLGLMNYGIAVARRGWLEKCDIINTYGLSELKKLLAK